MNFFLNHCLISFNTASKYIPYDNRENCLIKGVTKNPHYCSISLATHMLEGWNIIHLKGEIHSYKFILDISRQQREICPGNISLGDICTLGIYMCYLNNHWNFSQIFFISSFDLWEVFTLILNQPNILLTQNFFWSQSFWSQNFVGPEFFVDGKLFWTCNFSGPNTSGSNCFLIQHFFGPNIFYEIFGNLLWKCTNF